MSRNIQELLDAAEQLLASRNIQSKYILNISELRKVLPKTGLGLHNKARALGGEKIGNDEYMFDKPYAPEQLARQLLAEARSQQGVSRDSEFTSLGLAIARRGMSKKSFVAALPTGNSIISDNDVSDPTIRKDLEEITKIVKQREARITATVSRNLSETSRALGYLIQIDRNNKRKDARAEKILRDIEAKVKLFAEADATEAVTDTIVNTLRPNSRPRPKRETRSKVVKEPKETTIKPKLKLDSQGRLRLSGKFTSPVSLMISLNRLIHDYVAKHMGKGRELKYRTGRFANSVRITSLTATREQAISVFYTYMENPYQTFEPGFAQGHKGYDPRRLITTSIRRLLVDAFGITKALVGKGI